VILTMNKNSEWVREKRKISQDELELHIKRILCKIAFSSEGECFEKNELRISTHDIHNKLLCKTMDGLYKGGRIKKFVSRMVHCFGVLTGKIGDIGVIVWATTSEIHEVLKKISQEGAFEGGPTGFLMVDLSETFVPEESLSYENIILRTDKKMS